MKLLSDQYCFSGRQLRLSHLSSCCRCEMVVSIFLPPNPNSQTTPVVWWLSGLTCDDQNFVTKAGAQRVAAELGIAVVVPDTSPRGEGVAGDPDGGWDFGQGAGFYVNATQPPFAEHYQMKDYIQLELPQLLQQEFDLAWHRQSIMGHSMGGHGALTLALNFPEQYRSVSAFAPICAPTQCPWGQKALRGYLGENVAAWREADTVELIKTKSFDKPILIDQGANDPFLSEQLKPELLQSACEQQQIDLRLNYRSGYDHSYFFVATFIEEHLRYHYAALVN